ncbi:hypothetical protein GTP81_31345, partial [Rugamonas sp. FT107W]
MEYRFSLTPRLIALAIFSGVAMLVLLFALGYQVGVSMAERPAPEAIDNAAKRTRQQAAGKIGAEAAVGDLDQRRAVRLGR